MCILLFYLFCTQHSHEEPLGQSRCVRFSVCGFWVDAVVTTEDWTRPDRQLLARRHRHQFFTVQTKTGPGPVQAWSPNAAKVNTWCFGGKNPSFHITSTDLVAQHPWLTNVHSLLCVGTFVSLKAQWVPTLLEPPAHTDINYVVTDLQGGPRPPAPLEDNYRKNILTVSRCALWMQSDTESCPRSLKQALGGDNK